MIEDFWSEIVTGKSFEKLVELSKKYNVVVIGGWAVYLFTNMHKSKDIDIVIDYDTLFKMKSEYAIEKNDRLKKYEAKLGEFDIDIYLPSYSKLMLPIKLILEHTKSIKGMTTPTQEVLLILKQGAEINRRDSIKGRKDIIDIITLLIFSGFNFKIYRKLLKDYKLEFLENELIYEIKSFSLKDLKYIGLNQKEFSKWKKDFMASIKE